MLKTILPSLPRTVIIYAAPIITPLAIIASRILYKSPTVVRKSTAVATFTFLIYLFIYFMSSSFYFRFSKCFLDQMETAGNFALQIAAKQLHIATGHYWQPI